VVALKKTTLGRLISTGRTRQDSDKCFFAGETLEKYAVEIFFGLRDRKSVMEIARN
jgi:hypothetical protein